MREIKFRAKRIDIPQWVYGYYFKTPITEENSGISHEYGWFFLSDGRTRHCIVEGSVAFVINIKTLGEYTGLKDKNGKEIYEGDIVTRNKAGMVWLVEFWVDGGGWILKDKNNSLPGGVGLYQEQIDSDLKVIGNIYENPELLEVKKQNEKI